MQLAFLDRSCRQLCESETIAVTKLGASVARNLMRRLSDLRAVAVVSEIVAGRPREIDPNGPGEYRIDLAEGYVLIFCANHPNNPILENGNIDWSKVSRVKILGVKIDDIAS